jgi:hypothetical protein
MKIRSIVCSAALFGAACAAAAEAPRNLAFDAAAYTEKTATVDGRTVAYRAFEGIVYVANPADATYQRLNFYVPAEYYQGKSINGWTAVTAPIFFPNGVGGYLPAEPGTPGLGRDGKTNAALVALSRGCVVAAPGTRGRTTQDAAGRYTGKAPAAIVDLKAAVRYLRFNDAAMPGDAERIVSNGTSAGGGLSALLGASGNSPDYAPYLRALGAADARDDVSAVSAYCPITNLENADAAYEWLFNGVVDYRKIEITMLDYKVQRTEVKGTLAADQLAVSAELKALFPAYLNGLGLKDQAGKALTLDAAGTGSFADYVASFLAASAQKALDGGASLSSQPWATVGNGKVVGIDLGAYAAYAVRLKLPPAFDGLSLESGENSLFGAETVAARHFTAYSSSRGVPGGAVAEAQLVKLMNPMGYIGSSGATTSPFWRIRHGTVDRDTALAVPVILATRLANAGFAVDFALPWETPHSGDYDLEELFAWTDAVCR